MSKTRPTPAVWLSISAACSLEPDVPLVVPDVNPFVLADYRNRNVIAVPTA
jgi:aspartate-semialdehyde dehydrogenase